MTRRFAAGLPRRGRAVSFSPRSPPPPRAMHSITTPFTTRRAERTAAADLASSVELALSTRLLDQPRG